jgi:hypothetical protein
VLGAHVYILVALSAWEEDRALALPQVVSLSCAGSLRTDCAISLYLYPVQVGMPQLVDQLEMVLPYPDF